MLARFDERLSRRVNKLCEARAVADHLFHHDRPAFKSGWTFVTAAVALRSGVIQVLDNLLARLEGDADLLEPLASALAWVEYDFVRPHIRSLLQGSSSQLQRLGLLAVVAHRIDPGDALCDALDAEAPAVRAGALEAVGRLALRGHLPRLHDALQEQDPSSRFSAAWSAVRLGDYAGIRVLGRFTVEGGMYARRACDIALRALDTDQAIRAHHRLVSVAGNERLCVVAAGIIGEGTQATWLLNAMESLPLARQAGAAFSLVTGCDFRRDDLDAERPPIVRAPEQSPVDLARAAKEQSSEAQDDSLAYETDDDLAWPDTARVAKWWDQNRHKFVPGTRYLAGEEIRPGALRHVVRTGNQQQRAAAALELALLYPDVPLLDVTAPAHRQNTGVDRSQ